MDVQLPIEAKDIQKLIPHRYPFLQLDRITAFEPMKTLTAIKNVTMNEPQFQGHFPDLPVMPGVLIIEAMAQACGTLAILSEAAAKKTNSSSSPVSTMPVSNAKSSPATNWFLKSSC